MILVSGAISAIFVSDDTHGRLKFYDRLLILPREAKHIWNASWNWTKVLYFLTRYIPFVTVASMLRSELPFLLLRVRLDMKAGGSVDSPPVIRSICLGSYSQVMQNFPQSHLLYAFSVPLRDSASLTDYLDPGLQGFRFLG